MKDLSAQLRLAQEGLLKAQQNLKSLSTKHEILPEFNISVIRTTESVSNDVEQLEAVYGELCTRAGEWQEAIKEVQVAEQAVHAVVRAMMEQLQELQAVEATAGQALQCCTDSFKEVKHRMMENRMIIKRRQAWLSASREHASEGAGGAVVPPQHDLEAMTVAVVQEVEDQLQLTAPRVAAAIQPPPAQQA